MFENPRRGRQARNFTTNVPKILDLKSSSEQIFSRKLSLGAPVSKHVLIDDRDFENYLTSEACVCLLGHKSNNYCLIYAHGIENVLVSEACLFCLLLSRHDSFKECFD